MDNEPKGAKLAKLDRLIALYNEEAIYSFYEERNLQDLEDAHKRTKEKWYGIAALAIAKFTAWCA